ncbi:MAG: 16S rRNA (cytosine(1402)-N(4))-methyltransferase RsmH, partial [Fidelibacterota bacterium]
IRDNGHHLFHDNFRNFPEILKSIKVTQVHGILLDLGMSSFEVDSPSRGFSYMQNGPLDMRFDPSSGATLSEQLIQLKEAEICDIIRMYGEERYARKIANSIVQKTKSGRMNTTFDLRDSVLEVVKGKFRMKSVSRVFQAFRIFINDELESLKMVLESVEKYLKVGGRVAVLTFQSLEDRIVKQFFKNASNSCTCPTEIPFCVCDTHPTLKILTRKAILPSEDEIRSNSRSRSAKLRVAERI